MEEKELQRFVEDISLKAFGLPFRHKARFNRRLRTTGGRYLLHSHDLEFNKRQYDYFGLDELKAIIKHELCHYHLHLQGKGYRHRDSDFKELLEKVGGTRYCQTIPQMRRYSTKTYLFQCTVCEQKYERKRRMDLHRYVCGKCGGKLKSINKA